MGGVEALGAEAGSRGVPVGVEDLLVALATEVPDLRQRVGVADQVRGKGRRGARRGWGGRVGRRGSVVMVGGSERV